jgi:hypothetical protein
MSREKAEKLVKQAKREGLSFEMIREIQAQSEEVYLEYLEETLNKNRG